MLIAFLCFFSAILGALISFTHGNTAHGQSINAMPHESPSLLFPDRSAQNAPKVLKETGIGAKNPSAQIGQTNTKFIPTTKSIIIDKILTNLSKEDSSPIIDFDSTEKDNFQIAWPTDDVGVGDKPNPDLKYQQADPLNPSSNALDTEKSALLERIRELETRIRLLEDERTNKLPSQHMLESHASQPVGASSSVGRVKYLRPNLRKRILVTGGAGFVGSHLVDRLMMEGHEVIVVDNFYTGNRNNLRHWFGHSNFEMLHHDITSPLFIEVNEIYHLASPASPPHYMFNPIKTLKTNLFGTINMLGLAKRNNAKFLLASTSEVYGDPEQHPQHESYWGHANPIGPRSCYDEGKRAAEALTYAYARHVKLSVRVARIFNTFGPRMHMEDGRVVSNFIMQALRQQPITVYGDGTQTRSFQYVSDLVEGLVRLMRSDYTRPVNIGNPEEHSVAEFAKIIRTLTNSSSPIIYTNAAEDDPHRRRPNITSALNNIGWAPKVLMVEGLKHTISYFREELKRERLGEALPINESLPLPINYDLPHQLAPMSAHRIPGLANGADQVAI